jgi:hypothetical protein
MTFARQQGASMSVETEETKVSPRESLWRAALWAGFAHQDACVKALQSGKVPWFSELAPLSPEERVYIVGQLCKQWFPDMTGETEKEAFATLGRMYGVKRRRRWRHNAH